MRKPLDVVSQAGQASAPLPSFECFAIPGIPLIERGDDLAQLIATGAARAGRRLQSGDVVVVAQKAVSKAEGRVVDLSRIHPSKQAREIARQCEKDAREVELILAESSEVLRAVPGALIVVHRSGVILADAGLDHSNILSRPGEENVVLLPSDVDESCRMLRARLMSETGADVGVIINDSLGRPWRLGTIGVAIGIAGLAPIIDLRGEADLFGRRMKASQQAVADELASAAALLQGQCSEGRPVVVLRGDFALQRANMEGSAAALLRPPEMDLFR